MDQPVGFLAKGKEHLFCNLNRSIYSLKQSPYRWNDCHLKQMDFKWSESDPCIYTDAGGDNYVLHLHIRTLIILFFHKRRKANQRGEWCSITKV